jgi:hypothetical protein
LAAALAFALRYEGRTRVHNADEIMAEIVAKRLVGHLERAGFVVMNAPQSWAALRSGADSRADRLRRREASADCQRFRQWGAGREKRT